MVCPPTTKSFRVAVPSVCVIVPLLLIVIFNSLKVISPNTSVSALLKNFKPEPPSTSGSNGLFLLSPVNVEKLLGAVLNHAVRAKAVSASS